MAQSEMIVSPVGRYVHGSLTDKRDTDMDGRPIPEDKQQFEVGIAFRKDDPNINGVFQKIMQHAWTEFARAPNIQQVIQSFNLDQFSWKISDGDRPNRKGQTNQNTVGHWVFYFKSSFPISVCDQRNATMDPANLKRGYFVDVAFTCAGNGEMGDRAGVYLNPQIVRFIAYGEEIRGGISADEAFKGHSVPTQLPPGASVTPVAGGAMPGAGSPGMPAGNAPGPMGGAAPQMPGSSGQASMPGNGGMPQNTGPTAPTPAYPSNGAMPGNPAPGAMPAPSQPSNAPSTTGYPGSNVAPHPTFANGPQTGQ